MIKTIIFDFGDVFINLDKVGAKKHALTLFQEDSFSEDMIAFNVLFEQGLISTKEFLEFYLENFPFLKESQILEAWNYILKDFPKHRLEFLQNLKVENKYKLILLSNTNELHINWIIENISFYEEFKASFDEFYLSHEINLRKPNKDIYEFILNENDLKANECLFIDDTLENTEAAEELGIHCWNIDESTQDVTNLFQIKSALF